MHKRFDKVKVTLYNKTFTAIITHIENDNNYVELNDGDYRMSIEYLNEVITK
jgi:hypothetical protein